MDLLPFYRYFNIYSERYVQNCKNIKAEAYGRGARIRRVWEMSRGEGNGRRVLTS